MATATKNIAKLVRGLPAADRITGWDIKKIDPKKAYNSGTYLFQVKNTAKEPKEHINTYMALKAYSFELKFNNDWYIVGRIDIPKLESKLLYPNGFQYRLLNVFKK